MSPAAIEETTREDPALHELVDMPVFTFAGRWRSHPTAFALSCGALEGAGADCRAGLHDRLRP